MRLKVLSSGEWSPWSLMAWGESEVPPFWVSRPEDMAEEVALQTSKPARSSALDMALMAAAADFPVPLCSTVTTEVTTLGDTQMRSGPHASSRASLIVDTHDGQCRLPMRNDVMMWPEGPEATVPYCEAGLPPTECLGRRGWLDMTDEMGRVERDV